MRRGSVVENMLLAEYDYETDIAVQREEAWEEGMEMNNVNATASCTAKMSVLYLALKQKRAIQLHKLNKRVSDKLSAEKRKQV